jgi:cation:H+ antiporter
MELWVSIILFIVGLAFLIKGSDFFVGSAAFIARYFGVSQLIIGLTLVSMGTSLPELGASVYASYKGEGGIAIGNVVGSNIANIALVLGICLLLKRMLVRRQMFTRDGLVMIGVTVLFTLLAFGGMAGGITRLEGLLLMVIFASYLFILYKQNKEEMRNNNRNKKRRKKKEKGLGKEVLFLILGCFGVIFGAQLLVDSAVVIAETFSISATVIGSTIIAIGTSLPELAVSLTAIIKKHSEISIGNIIGSNIFNILWVVGVAALVGNMVVDSMLLYTNIPIMLIVAVLLIMFMASKKVLERWEGAVFVAIYAVFIMLNYPFW